MRAVILIHMVALVAGCASKDKRESASPKLMLPVGHTERIESAHFSTDTKYVITASRDKTAKVWELSSGKLVSDLVGHSDFVRSAQFSNDGRLVLTTSSDGTARIWSEERMLYVLKGTGEAMWGGQFSPDYKFVLTFGDDVVQIWETEGGKLLKNLEGHAYGINSAEFSLDGEKIVTAGSIDKTAKIWDTSTGTLLFDLVGHKYDINSARFSIDGKYVVTGSSDSTAIIWEAADGKILYKLTGHKGRVVSASFSSDGEYVVTASDDSTAKVWETTSGKLLNELKHNDMVSSCGFSQDGTYVLTGSDRVSKVWVAATGELKFELTGGKPEFSVGGKYLVTLDYYRPMIWDMVTGEQERTLEGHANEIGSAQIGEGFVTTEPNYEGHLRIRESFTGRLYDNLTGNGGSFSTNGKFLVFYYIDKIKTYEINSKRILDNLQTNFSRFKLSPDGRRVVTTSSDGSVKVWSATTGEFLRNFSGHTAEVSSAKFSNDGRYLVTASADSTAKIWEVSSGVMIQNLTKHSTDVLFSEFSLDGLRVMTYDGSVKIWDVNNGTLLREFEGLEVGWFGRNEPVAVSPFSQNGKRIVGFIRDSVPGIFEVSSGRMLGRLNAKEGGFAFARFSPDDKFILTGSYNGTTMLWDATNGNQIKEFKGYCMDIDAGWGTLLTHERSKLRLYDIATGMEMLSWIELDSIDWVVTHPSGLFDASPGAMDKLHFVQGLDIIDFEQLKERYYEPELWKKIMNKEKLRDVSSFRSIDLPPDLTNTEISEQNTTKLTATNRDGGIGQITVTVNGMEVVEDLRVSGFDDDQKTWTHELKLGALPNLKLGEENLVEVKAWNKEHWVISRPLQIRFTPASTRGAVMEVTEGSTGKVVPSIFILAAGISDYEGSKIDLKFAAKDALSMSRSLALGAKKLFGKDKAFVFTLTDSSAEKPTKANIAKAFKEISARSTPHDVLVVYLSGHGINWGGDLGDFYYLTKDAYSTDVQAYNDPGIRDRTAISSKELIELFKSVPSDKRVLIIDACASGKMVQNLMESRDISSSTLRALDKLKDRTGFHIITGCAADAVSYEASRFGQGVLTYSLIEGMKGASLDQQKFVDVNKLFQYAREQVPVLAKGIGGIQEPQVFSPKGSQSFPIGELDDESKKSIPLPNPRSVYIRSAFFDEATLDDPLQLGSKLDNALNDISANGERSSLVFFDVSSFEGGCRVSGKYRRQGSQIQLTFNSGCGKASLKTIAASDPETLVEMIIKAVQK